VAQLIDSSVFIEFERRARRGTVRALPVPREDTALAAITASELLVGVYRADSPQRRRRREALIEGILERIPVLPFDLEVARTHARISVQLAAAGQPIGTHDLLIAATALAHGYSVLTYNLRDFQRVPGLFVRQPTW
jgi:tRNA(fMet)-specific endonuclease VapC